MTTATTTTTTRHSDDDDDDEDAANEYEKIQRSVNVRARVRFKWIERTPTQARRPDRGGPGGRVLVAGQAHERRSHMAHGTTHTHTQTNVLSTARETFGACGWKNSAPKEIETQNRCVSMLGNVPL